MRTSRVDRELPATTQTSSTKLDQAGYISGRPSRDHSSLLPASCTSPPLALFDPRHSACPFRGWPRTELTRPPA
jgi:hypothetical protein